MSELIRGGGHVGPKAWFGYHGTWPFSSLEISHESLTFKLWPLTYDFDRSSVVGLLQKRIFGWTSPRIVHNKPEYSEFIGPVEAALKDHGYQIVTDESQISLPPNIQYSKTMAAISYVAVFLGLLAALYAMFVTQSPK